MAYQLNQKQAHIRELQRYLHGISYFNTAIPHLTADGVYGKETAMAVRAFQQQYGLHPTGETNRATWDAVVQQFQLFVTQPATELTIFPAKLGRSGSGDVGFTVYVVQAILESLCLEYENLFAVPVNGTYGAETKRAVMQFQRENGLRPTGEVNAATWNMLAAAINTFSG